MMPADLDVPTLPHEFVYLWNYFQSIARKRTGGMGGPDPLSDDQIMAWQRRNNVVLTPFENECIDALDQVYLDSAKKK